MRLKNKNKSIEERAWYEFRTFDSSDTWLLKWDAAIIVFALFNAIFIPFSISFDDIKLILDNSTAFIVINASSYFFFFIDILIVMNTSFFNADGEEILDRSTIIGAYMRGPFILDLLSTIPFEYMTSNAFFNSLGILKIFRVSRLAGLINKSALDEETKSTMRVLYIILILVVFLHVLAAVWHFIIMTEQLWIPPVDFVFAGVYPQVYRVYDKAEIDMWHKYLLFLYHSLLFLGGNEMGPRTELEAFTSTVILVVMSILNAALFGQFAVEVEKKGRK